MVRAAHRTLPGQLATTVVIGFLILKAGAPLVNPLVTPTTEEAVVGSGAVGPANTAGEGARSLGRARVRTLATEEEDEDVGKEGVGAGCAAPLRLFEAAPQRKNWGKKLWFGGIG